MKIVQAFKVAAIVLLLPAVGVAVAATTSQHDLPLSATEPETVASSTDADAGSSALADVVTERVDGRQDSGTRAHWVWLDDFGNVTGKVSVLGSDGEPVAVSDMDIKLFADDVEVQAVTSQANGKFTFQGLEPGIYSLIGRTADETQLSLAFYALPKVQDGELGDVQIDALAVTGDNQSVIQEIKKQYLPSIALDETATSTERFAKVSRQSFYLPPSTERVNIEAMAREVNTETFASTALLHHPVLAENGMLKGELAQIVGSPIQFTRMKAYLVRNNQIAKTGLIEEDGSFSFEGVAPGTYAFVAAGQGGFACVSIKVTELPEGETAALESDYQFVSAPVKVLNKRASTAFLSVALVPQEFVAAAIPAPPQDDIAPAPAGGAFGGFQPTFNGGGGGGGGLNLRRLGLIGAGVAIPLALSDDNGDGGGQASPDAPAQQ